MVYVLRLRLHFSISAAFCCETLEKGLHMWATNGPYPGQGSREGKNRCHTKLVLHFISLSSP